MKYTELLLCLAASGLLTQPLQAEPSELCNDPCNACCRSMWGSAEYLLWKIQNSPEPVPLVIETADGSVVLGDRHIDTGWHSGARFNLGCWFDASQYFGIEANYFFLANNSKKFKVSSDADGSPALRVPYFNVTTGLEDSSPLATPGLYAGTASLKLNNSMQGAELNVLMALPSSDDCLSFGVLAGFRYWNFEETLKFFASSPIISPPSIYHYYDKFGVQNNFYGGQLGACLGYNDCSWRMDLKGKVALGVLSQTLKINGAFTTNQFTGSQETFAGGFFAEPSNIGHHHKNQFSIIPELDICLGYQVTDCLEVQVGYSVLYASNVVYAGKQIDPNINPTQSANIDFTPTPALVGKAAPKAKFETSGLWVQGLNAGFIFQF